MLIEKNAEKSAALLWRARAGVRSFFVSERERVRHFEERASR